MKQLLQDMRTGETFITEVPIPTPEPGTALVRTAASLVSAGTERMLVDFAEKSLIGKARTRPDLVRHTIDKARREGILTTVETVLNRLDQPLTLGYSSAGTIVELGEYMPGFQVGQRVACAGGGYAVHAEYAIVPRNLIAQLPGSVDFDSASFTTLGAISLHGFRLGQAGIGERVAIIGLGLLGLLTVGIANAAGCQVFGIDLNPTRVKLAKQVGAQLAVMRDEAESASQSFTRGRGFDVILICADTSSSDPVQLAGMLARDRARIVSIGAVGLELPRKVYYEKELNFINSRSYGPGRYDPAYEEKGNDYPIGYVRWTEGRNLEAFVDLLAGQKIDVNSLITHRFPIKEAPGAYDLITGKKPEQYLGVIISYDSDPAKMPRTTQEENQSVPLATASIAYPNEKVQLCKIGVLGAGEYARSVLLPAFHKINQVDFVGIASPSGLSANNSARRFGFHYANSNENNLINDNDINTLVILTRHNLHSPLALAGLKSGKHVFCEKPIAINESDLLEIEKFLSHSINENVQKSNDRINSNQESPTSKPIPLLMVGFNRRFSRFAVELKEFFYPRQEPFVIHYRVNAGYLPLTHWLHDPKQGGGRIIGECCHFIDFLTFLVGDNPTSVTASALPDSGRYQRDNVVMTFAFPDGSLGTIEYLANGDKVLPKERLEAFSGGKVGVLDDFRSLEMAHAGRRKVLRNWLRQDKGHQAECREFVDAILNDGPPPIPYSQIIGVARATFAAVQALDCQETIPIRRVGG